jgi:hypothetical protein
VSRVERDLTDTYKGIPKWVSCRGGYTYNPEFVKLWESYLDEGMSASAVAQVFGVHKGTVLNHYPGRGWTTAQGLELGTYMKHHNERMRRLKV